MFVEAGGGRYWLDVVAEQRQTRRRRLLLLMLGVLAMFAVMLLVSRAP